MPGLFITFEGADGAGKTTQLALLADYLRAQGWPVRCTREPGGTPLGDAIRTLLLDPANVRMAPRTEALLYMAARAQHVAEVIAPALARGEIVLSDRYADSTIVYQGVARQLPEHELAAINAFATGGLEPDLTILLDCRQEVLSGRMAGRGAKDRIEREAARFHEQVRQGFLRLAAASDRFCVIEADGSVQAVHARVIAAVQQFLDRRGSR